MKPESRLIKRIHDKLPKEIHREKNHNMYRGGTADVWYSGNKADLWVEYKWIKNIPKNGLVVPDLSGLQKKWLRDRYTEGRRVIVVVGCPKGCIVFGQPTEWENGLSDPLVISEPTLVAWLTKVLSSGGTNGSNKNAKKLSGKQPIDI